MSQLMSIARRAMRERGLEPDFSAAARAEVEHLDGPARDTGSALRDLRDRLWCSIDNDDSRDLDQLSVAEPAGAGAVKVLVAIADVDALVARGSAIDQHAQTNTTSVYTAAGIFPMLPEQLSTDLTSLGENADRIAMVVEMTVAQDGSLTGSDVYRANVRNHAKLAYDSVAAWLDGNAPPPPRVAAVSGMANQLRTQNQVSLAMKQLRHQRGALSLETGEARAVFDEGVLSDLRPEATNRAKELIEDFMVAANGVTVRFLDARGFPSLRRVLRSPERWDRIVGLAGELGERLPAQPSASALESFLMQRRQVDPRGFADLSLSVVKLLGRGEYVLELPGQRVEGHFGLAVKNYGHSTAPNRRFPDLATQRLLKAALAGARVPYSNQELGAIAENSTRQEDNAAKVERLVRKAAAALLLAPRIGERFDAVVTGASVKGTWVRVTHPLAEGKLISGFEGLDVGDRVRVRLVATDVDRGYVDFARAKGS
jgi:exoribonuclease-2